MDAEETIRDFDPPLWEAVKPHVAEVPDPRPPSVVATYEEMWDEKAFWARLLHELQALSIDERDAKFLSDLQNYETSGIAFEHHLRERAESWLSFYPITAWTLQYTNRTVAIHLAIIVGRLLPMKSRDVTIASLDFIRDFDTARAMRKLKASFKSISYTVTGVVKALKARKIGLLYWIFVVFTEFSDPLEKSIRNLMAHTLSTILSDESDEEIFLPLLDAEIPISNKVLLHLRGGKQPPIAFLFPRFLRATFESYLKRSREGTNNKRDPLDRFLNNIYGNSSKYVLDEESAYYFVTRYLSFLEETKKSYNPTLGHFVSPIYRQVHILLADIDLDKEGMDNLMTVGKIALWLHEAGENDVAEKYHTTFVRISNARPEMIVRENVFINGHNMYTAFDGYLYRDLNVNARYKVVVIHHESLGKLSTDEYEELFRAIRNDSQQKKLVEVFARDIGKEPSSYTSIVQVVASLLTVENAVSLFHWTASYAEWALLYAQYAPLDKTVYSMYNLRNVERDVWRIVLERVGEPPENIIPQVIVSNIHELIFAFSVDSLRDYAKNARLGHHFNNMALAVKYTQVTGLTLTELLGKKKRFFIHTLIPARLKDLLDYKGDDVDWKMVVDIIINNDDNQQSPAAIEKLFTRHQPSNAQMVTYILRLLSAENYELLTYFVTPSILRLLTPGLREEVARKIKLHETQKDDENA